MFDFDFKPSLHESTDSTDLFHRGSQCARKAATGHCGNQGCGFQKGKADKHSSRLIKSFRRIDGELIFLAQRPKWQCDSGGCAVAEVIPLFLLQREMAAAE